MLFRSKLASLAISTTTFIVAGSALILLAGGLLFGWQGAAYPVTTGARYYMENNMVNGVQQLVPVLRENSVIMLPRWEYALYLVVLTAAVNICIAVLAFAVSTVIRNNSIAIAFAVMSGVGSFVITRMFESKSPIAYFFMHYIHLAPVWNGTSALNTMNGNINLGFGFLVTGAWMAGALVTGFLVFTRRDVMV